MKKLLILLAALLLCGCASTEAPEVSPTESPSPSPVATSSPTPKPTPMPAPTSIVKVHTDYSKLKARTYENDAPAPFYTRLREEPMPELVPAGDYGLLITYVGEQSDSMYFSENMEPTRYGLATIDGVIITDAVYISAFKIGRDGKELYILSRTSGDESEFALCAIDGSWISPFYTSEGYFDMGANVIVLTNDYSTGDYCVFDYSGNLLFNVKDILKPDPTLTECGYYVYAYETEGWLTATYNDGGAVLINAFTGELVDHGYEHIGGFYSGLAPVKKDGLWGFINTDLEVVIDFQFLETYGFNNNRANCRQINNKWVTIDRYGEIIFSGEYTDELPNPLRDSDGIFAYVRHSYIDGSYKPHYFDRDMIPLPENTFPLSIDAYYVKSEDGITVHHGSKERFIESAYSVSLDVSGLFTYDTRDAENVMIGTGVFSMDDGVLLNKKTNGYAYISIYAPPTREPIIEFTEYSQYSSKTSYYDLDGNEIFSSGGFARYYPETDLFYARTDKYNAYYTPEGELIFCYHQAGMGSD